MTHFRQAEATLWLRNEKMPLSPRGGRFYFPTKPPPSIDCFASEALPPPKCWERVIKELHERRQPPARSQPPVESTIGMLITPVPILYSESGARIVQR